MAGWPWLVEANFELGTIAPFTSETDVTLELDIAHYAELARVPLMPMPWRGAYCMRLDFSIGQTDAYLTDTTSYDILSSAQTMFVRFMLWFGQPGAGGGSSYVAPTMADGDRFTVFQIASAGPVGELTVFLEYTTASGYRVGLNKTLSATGAVYSPLTLNEWHSVEAAIAWDAAAGTLQLWVDDQSMGTITGKANLTATDGFFGARSIPATTTKGILLLDDFIAASGAQIYAPRKRFPQNRMLTKSAHVAVGPAEAVDVELIPGNADNVLRIWDTDTAETTDFNGMVAELKPSGGTETAVLPGAEVEVRRGLFVELSGTNPRARLKLNEATGYGSEGAVRSVAASRTARRPSGY